MSPGLISRVVVADKIASELHGILSKDVRDVDAVVSAITDWLLAHPDRVDAKE